MEAREATGIVSRFFSLFSGMDRAYGCYNITGSRDDGKVTGSATTKRGKVTPELWEAHLAGRTGLGIVPIKDGNTCRFGAIDVDQYDINHQALAARIRGKNLPLVVCRTKSGGAHLYVFFSEDVDAGSLRSKLTEVAAFLGFGNSEIFPKQSKVLSEQGDVGGWINVPYFGGTRGMRYAITPEGEAMDPEQFLDFAESSKVGRHWLQELLVVGQEFVDGPPCLQALAQNGFPLGSRNDGLYNVAVYLKMAFPDNWELSLPQYNLQHMHPPLTNPEVQGVIKSVRKKDYRYTCSRPPIVAHCNSATCKTRKFGIGNSAGGRFPTLGGLTKLTTDPPIWFWDVDGIRVELTTTELQDPRLFQRRCMESVNLFPPVPGAAVWQAAVQNAMDNLTVVEAPKDALPEGQLLQMLERFCVGRAQALSLDEIVLGKPYCDGKRHYFRIGDLYTFLARNKFYDVTKPKIASILRDSGAEHHVSNLCGRCTNYWSIPALKIEEEKLKVPKEVEEGKDPF